MNAYVDTESDHVQLSPGDRLRDGHVRAGLGQLGDLGEDAEVVLHGLRRAEAGVDPGEAARAMSTLRKVIE